MLLTIEQDGASPERFDRLYSGLGILFAAHLEHMHEEEQVTQALLWKHFTDAELMALRATILQQLGPERMLTWFRHIFPALRPQERAGMLKGFLANAPAPLAERAVLTIREAIGDAAWNRTGELMSVTV